MDGDSDFNFDQMPSGRWNHYARDGERITWRQWAELIGRKYQGDTSYSRVAETTVGPYWVSTVWLGYDNAWQGPPMIFETMVFRSDDGTPWHEHAMRRYTTEDEARAGHELTVIEVEGHVRMMREAEEGQL